MALANYTDLQTSIASWLDRSDLTSVIPDFIALFEATANTEGAIRTLFNKTSATLNTTANQNYVSTPSDFLAPEGYVLTISGSYVPLASFGTSSNLYQQYSTTTTQAPQGFISLASKLELAPTPDAVYAGTLYYYAKIPALATNSTNWLLTNFPQIYLFGSLVASEAYLGTDQGALSKWGTLYDNAIQKLQGSTDRNKYGGSALTVKVDAVA